MQLYRNIFNLLPERAQKRFYQMLVLIFATGVLETVGVISVLPFLALLANPSLIESNAILSVAYEFMGAPGYTPFLMTLGFFAIAIISFSTGVRLIARYAIVKFAAGQEYNLTTRLLKNYLGQPYDWFITRNTATLSKTLLSEVGQTTRSVIIPSIELIANSAVALCLVGLLIVIDPVVALGSAVVLGGVYALLMASLRKYIGRLGKRRLTANRRRFRLAAESMNGIKDVKFLGLEGVFVERFRVAASTTADVQRRFGVVQEFPRAALEVVLFSVMLGVLLFFLARNDGSLAAVIPQAGLFAVATMRLFPRMQGIYGNFNMITQGLPALRALLRDFEDTRASRISQGDGQQPMALHGAITLSDVAFTYRGSETPSLSGVSLEIRANTTVGFVGSTGAGKTTIVDVILGLLAPTRGHLAVDGVRIGPENVDSWRRALGYVPQQIFLLDDTVAANIAFGVPHDQIDMAAVERAARIASLHDFVVSDLPEGYQTTVGERGMRFSGGQRQRVGIARALYRDPSVLIFDEATSALDNRTERDVMEAVNALHHDKTIIMIAHRLSTVRHCDEIIMLERGEIAGRGDYTSLIASNESFRSMAAAQ